MPYGNVLEKQKINRIEALKTESTGRDEQRTTNKATLI